MAAARPWNQLFTHPIQLITLIFRLENLTPLFWPSNASSIPSSPTVSLHKSMGVYPHTRVGRILPVRHPGSERPTSARPRARTCTERVLREDGTCLPFLFLVPTFLSIVRQPTGPIETTLCDYETVESVNNVLYNQLHELVQTSFFKYFRVC